MRRIFLLSFFIPAATAACGGDADRADAGTAGERIPAVVESGGEEVVQWTLAREPLVEIGDLSGVPLVQVSRAVRIGQTLVVVDAGTQKLGFFSEDGSLLREAGGRGYGPGEFQHPGWVGALAGDSVLVWDGGVRRFSVFAADGTWARSFEPQGLTGSFPGLHGVFSDGSVLMTSGMAMAGHGSAPRRDTVSFLRVGPDGEVEAELGRYPGPEYYDVEGGPGGGRSYARPFGRETFAAVHGDVFWVATGDEYEIVEHAIDGQPRRVLRRRVPPVRLGRGDVRAYREDLLSAVGAAERDAWRHALDAASFPDRLPPIAGLVAGADGAVWVREAQPPSTLGEGVRWTMFAADGRPHARITVPPRYTLWQAGHDWILGGYTASDGSERVRLYRIEGR